MAGLTLDELLATSVRLCVAGGPEKIAAIRAALRAGFVTHLATYMETSAALMRDGGDVRNGRRAASR